MQLGFSVGCDEAMRDTSASSQCCDGKDTKLCGNITIVSLEGEVLADVESDTALEMRDFVEAIDKGQVFRTRTQAAHSQQYLASR